MAKGEAGQLIFLKRRVILECFFVMVFIENYCVHAPDPRETAALNVF
jgi:hypothetical protein